MHIPTHIMSGWCFGNLFRLTPRERFLCMLAASLQDLDGLGIVFSEELYWDWHHKLGHSLISGIVLAAVLMLFSTHRIKAFAIYLALFHLHLLLDYFGSGPGWPLYYLWPFSDAEWLNPRAWEFFSWQNITAAAGLLIWVIAIAIYAKRTPLEWIMPNLDRQLLELLHRFTGKVPDRPMQESSTSTR